MASKLETFPTSAKTAAHAFIDVVARVSGRKLTFKSVLPVIVACTVKERRLGFVGSNQPEFDHLRYWLRWDETSANECLRGLLANTRKKLDEGDDPVPTLDPPEPPAKEATRIEPEQNTNAPTVDLREGGDGGEVGGGTVDLLDDKDDDAATQGGEVGGGEVGGGENGGGGAPERLADDSPRIEAPASVLSSEGAPKWPRVPGRDPLRILSPPPRLRRRRRSARLPSRRCITVRSRRYHPARWRRRGRRWRGSSRPSRPRPIDRRRRVTPPPARRSPRPRHHPRHHPRHPPRHPPRPLRRMWSWRFPTRFPARRLTRSAISDTTARRRGSRIRRTGSARWRGCPIGTRRCFVPSWAIGCWPCEAPSRRSRRCAILNPTGHRSSL